MDQQPARQLTFYRIKACFLLLLALTLNVPVLFTNVQAASDSRFKLPANHQITYSIEKYGSYVGNLKNKLLYEKGVISYTSVATAKGFAALFLKANPTETSILDWPETSDLTQPEQQSYLYTQEKKHKKNQQILFDHSVNGKTLINGSYKFKPYNLQTEHLVWSRQIIPLLMSNDLQQNPAITSNSFYITDKGHIRKYTYTLENAEDIAFENQKVPVLKFKISKQDGRRMSYVWLSKNHYYLPLKIEQYKDNDLNVRMLMTHFNLI
ncbi:MAG: DUF3108 domain-containing protein [Gammaproteobacteria bacterium]|nr:DUF3108 domain-containing protein [Gammaproteobacteria bacterium]